ncbi:hypothetical protein Enr13x_02940 [Stieleria neptunia]|uniref:Uncharacterized protein n=1 Tax=Stieleria neptunia TaxID=2527979 RepID=A0A518HI14_9BACT|nr:hypothetical protein Enr13x_02940 [Stieleria neptunia]
MINSTGGDATSASSAGEFFGNGNLVGNKITLLYCKGNRFPIDFAWTVFY